MIKISFNSTEFLLFIALIRLPNAIQFSKYIAPIRMPSMCETPKINGATVIGYEIANSLTHGFKLEKIPMKTVPNGSCGKWFSLSKHRSSIICANMQDEMAWNGEKGNPLVKDDLLIGLLSFAWRDGPNRFTNVCSYLDWIDSKTSKSDDLQHLLDYANLGKDFGWAI